MKVIKKDNYILIEGLKKSYGERQVLGGIELNIESGEFVAIVGKSGCGKSTLLRLIAGLEPADHGSIMVNGQQLTGLNKTSRIMFQDGRLLPWKQVIENVCIGLPDSEKIKAMDALKQVGLEDRMNDWPAKLSGGQKQRVALARALVHNPSILLLDEPLGALDALTRIEMQDLLESLWMQQKFTSVLVTHDVEEAVSIADRVILIEDGVISLNQPILLPRPRQRTHPAFSRYMEEILGKILNRSSPKISLVRELQES
ncbi:aliphatic sulfonate ABC transporter ATP-binding protein [Oceanobacillus zhaokaii]|uniref:Aliphatic sulfonate ABC transporter ATP-binding protein n=1 Tax=Oceanobacillus zhaokaii TaxID=2052660 RepID=A0A345PCJ7_9BACI|nr:ATP-binding cassette domain-containing protein [Oceanobacillus zhaokaii]AXI07727.1 aliphatic sulfonate ABC transporter ATP-binding protein [Oceanobacillus zhaokaii]